MVASKPDTKLKKFLDIKPTRRAVLSGILVGIGGYIAGIRGTQAGHINVTDVDDDEIQSFKFSALEYYELENIAAGDVAAPGAGLVRIFRDTADNLLKRKNPDNSIQSLESAAGLDHGALSGLADDDHTQYILVTGARSFTGAVQIVSSDAKIIFDDTGEADPLGEYNILSNNDIFSIEGRNAGDDAWEDIITIERVADGGLVDFRGTDGISLLADANLKRMEANILGTDDDFWIKGEQLYFGADKLSYIDRNVGSFRFFTDFNDASAQRRGTINRYWSEVPFEFETMYLQQKNIAKPNAVADHSSLYAKDVASSSEMFVIDEADNETQISPHNFTMFAPDLNLPYPWSYYSKNEFIGIEIGVNLAQAIKDLEGITGKTYIHTRPVNKKSWAENQNKIKTDLDNLERERAQEKEGQRRAPLVAAQMEIPVPVTRAEAVQRKTVILRVELTDERGQPIKEFTGDQIIDEETGELIPETKTRTEIRETKDKYSLKPGYEFNKRSGTFTRRKTKAEAEAAVSIRPLIYPRYRKRNPAKWMIDRGVN